MANEVFTLEALEAKHGDALVLHYGPITEPRFIAIDGGPAGVYKATMRPRLDEIRQNRGGGQLEIRMLMVSHIDDDHVAGVLDFSTDLLEDQENGQQLPFDILTLWHNSFDDIIAKMGTASVAELMAAQSTTATTADAAAIVASVKQGRQLRLNADALGLNMNSGFDDLIRFDKKAKPLTMGAGLQFTVLGPRKDELDALKEKWKKELPALLKKNKSTKAAAAEFVDKSVHNLSSVIVLATFDKKTMLLTGDARGDFILESLKEAKLLKAGKIEVDILKVPHHGSHHNIAPEFFEAIHAQHYVFSANGRDGNPDPPTFDDLFKARPKGPYHLWLTNDVKPAVTRIKAKKPAGVTLHIRKPNDRSVRIELGQPITW